MAAPFFVAGFDSATAMAKALGACLHGKGFPAVGQPAALAPLAAQANLLPWPVRRQVYIWSGWADAIPTQLLPTVSSERFGRWVGGLYPPRRYPAVAVGSSSGAGVHLCAALGIPWLPQTFLVGVHRHGDPDDAVAAMRFGERHAAAVLDPNPDLDLHHMHDANQDRLMIRRMTYFRFKHRRLSRAYRRFLNARLQPGGTLLVFDCDMRWPTVRLGDRHVFQHGAVGGLTPEEYYGDSDRVVDFLAREGSRHRVWKTPDPDGDSAEAEWGFGGLLGEDLARFAREHGYRLIRLRYDRPGELSPFVADLTRAWYRRHGVPTDTLLLGSFILVEPWWALRAGAVPFWATFNVESDAAALERYLSDAEQAGEPLDDAYGTLFSHGVRSVGFAPAERWKQVLSRARRHAGLVGVDEDAYPGDFAVYGRYDRDLPRVLTRRLEPPPALTVGEVEAFAAERGDGYGVKVDPGP